AKARWHQSCTGGQWPPTLRPTGCPPLSSCEGFCGEPSPATTPYRFTAAACPSRRTWPVGTGRHWAQLRVSKAAALGVVVPPGEQENRGQTEAGAGWTAGL
ncbi:unnamed protein product, partial [Ectocarpus fasciculatus]